MFYSHEVLTQRKYGVATIWLVATLGSKSGLKKVHRRDILSVNVPKACQTVIQPDAPLALRLQSNLLYGISRVYSGQCDYLINDASMAHTNIKRLTKSTTISAANLNLIGGRARPEQLVLNDDPAFLPDISLATLPDGIDFVIDDEGALFTLDDSLGISSLNFERAGSVYSLGQAGSQARLTLGSPRPNLMISTSDTMAGDYGFLPGSPVGKEGEAGNRFLDDVDFEFDADGEMRELELPVPPKGRDSMASGRIDLMEPSRTRRERVQSIGRGSRLDSEDIAKQVLLEHEEGRGGDFSRSHVLDGDDNTYAPPGDNMFDIDAEPFPVGPRQLSTDAVAEGNAPIRRKRGPRSTIVTIDDITELHNVELKAWRDNYLSNMEAAMKKSQSLKIARKAKANAKSLLFEVGFFGELRNPVLKTLFSAEALLDTINQTNGREGARTTEGARKRKRIHDEDEGGLQDIDGEDEEGRRARVKTLEGLEREMGLSNIIGDEYELPMNQAGEDEIEIGREGPELASDGIRPSSQAAFPWNAMSVRKSQAGSLMMSGGLLPSVGGFPSSSMGGSQMDLATRRGSRVSAIRGGPERLSVLRSPIGERDEEVLGELGIEFPEEEVDFEYFGAGKSFKNAMVGSFTSRANVYLLLGANVDTQTAQDSQWLAATVEQESNNFFEFLKAENVKSKQKAEDNGQEPTGFITFDELLDPTRNGKIVAAQAFHHTLLLATKGVVYVSQEESYGTIQISIM